MFLAAADSDQIGPSVHIVGSGQGAFVGSGAQVRRAVPGAAPTTYPAATIRQLAASIDDQKVPALDVQNLPSADSTASAVG